MVATHVNDICIRICIRNQTNTLRFCREDNPLYVFTLSVSPCSHSLVGDRTLGEGTGFSFLFLGRGTGFLVFGGVGLILLRIFLGMGMGLVLSTGIGFVLGAGIGFTLGAGTGLSLREYSVTTPLLMLPPHKPSKFLTKSFPDLFHTIPP